MSQFELSKSEIETLISEKSISDLYPWNTDDENLIDQFYKTIFFDITRKVNVHFLTDFDHYGSGYSSYIPTFFYNEKCKIKQIYPAYNQNFIGLEVYFCRLAPYFIMLENEYRWQQHSHNSERFNGFPHQNRIDEIQHANTQHIAQHIETLLSEFGLKRLNKEILNTSLNGKYQINTVLNDRAYRYFDAFFHWED